MAWERAERAEGPTLMSRGLRSVPVGHRGQTWYRAVDLGLPPPLSPARRRAAREYTLGNRRVLIVPMILGGCHAPNSHIDACVCRRRSRLVRSVGVRLGQRLLDEWPIVARNDRLVRFPHLRAAAAGFGAVRALLADSQAQKPAHVAGVPSSTCRRSHAVADSIKKALLTRQGLLRAGGPKRI